MPLVIRLHSSSKTQSDLLNLGKNLQFKISNYFEKLSFKYADSLSSVSNFAFYQNSPFIPNYKKVHIYGNSINLEKVNNIVQVGSNVAFNKPYVVFVGRLEILKGILDLTEALPAIFADLNDLNIYFIGKDNSGPIGFKSMVDYIYSKIPLRFKSNLIFKGHLNKDNLYLLMKDADAVIFPSLIETFGYVIIESMAVGVPIISTESGGAQEIIDHSKDGILIPKNNPFEIAQWIIKVVKDRDFAKTLISNAKEKVKSYDVNIITNKVIEHYNAVIDGK